MLVMSAAVMMAVGCGSSNQEWVCDCTTNTDNFATEVCGTTGDAEEVSQGDAESMAKATCEAADEAHGPCVCDCTLQDAPDDGSNECDVAGGSTSTTGTGTTGT